MIEVNIRLLMFLDNLGYTVQGHCPRALDATIRRYFGGVVFPGIFKPLHRRVLHTHTLFERS